MGWASYKALGFSQGRRGQEDLVSCNLCFQDWFGVCKLGVTGLVKWVSSSGVRTGVLVNGVSDKEISVWGLSGDLGVTASRGD